MTSDELDERLSKPSASAIESLASLDGDVILIGAGGKMGPSLARMARRALDTAGSEAKVIAVSRFSKPQCRAQLEEGGVQTIGCDLLDRDAVDALPDAAAVLFLAGMKFGTSADQARTWAHNAWLPGMVAHRYQGVPTVVFSSGNVYPFVDVESRGASEETEPSPMGEYAQSVLARERIFEYFSSVGGTKAVLYRLNYAAELRYGVPLDIAQRVFRREPVDLAMGYFNFLWQGDANAIALSCLRLVESPPSILNVTGPETVSVRALAEQFGDRFGKEPVLRGKEERTALLSDSSRMVQLFGPPEVSSDRLVEWIGDWVESGGPTLHAPTHYESRDGTF